VNLGGHLTDVPGLKVGHAHRIGRGWRTGTTVVLLPPGTTAGVDVRGGGPGTRETDLLHPSATIDTAHALCFTGGSAYGLAAAGGVMEHLEARGIGFQVGPAARDVVPLVPSAVIFDLGRGGDFTHRPDHGFGLRAARAARSGAVPMGSVGAGMGARARGLQGGVGTASTTLPNGVVVSAMAVVNAAGSVIDPDTGLPWESSSVRLRRPSVTDRARLREHLLAGTPPLNTTIDDLGSFELRSDAEEQPARRTRVTWLNAVLEAGAQCFAAACTDAIVLATATGNDPAYRDLCPTAFPSTRRSG
jgi:L-aminopeptidase/D-esterase-like protein